MRLNPRILKDRLTVQVVSPAQDDPNSWTQVAAQGSAAAVVTDWPCSDQDMRLRQRNMVELSGIAGSLPVSLCYCAWFPWPALADGQTVRVMVNDRERPLMKAGPPVDVGGQKQVYQLELGPPKGGG